MSIYTQHQAASDIAAAFRALPAGGTTTIVTVAPQRARMAGTGLSNVDFGKGHPPRGIPPL
ncbi:MAG TPA: hypothetical protein VHO01_07470 [Jatrophihabitans sp.]|nr:hypothetical protein [Jatrophihabitans sp.]